MVPCDEVTFAIVFYSTGSDRNPSADQNRQGYVENRQGYVEHLLEPLSAEAEARGYLQKPLLGMDLDQFPLVRSDDVTLRVETATQFTAVTEGLTESDVASRFEVVEEPSSVKGGFKLTSIIRGVQIRATWVNSSPFVLELFSPFLDALHLCTELIDVTAGIVLRCGLAAGHDGRHDMQVHWD